MDHLTSMLLDPGDRFSDRGHIDRVDRPDVQLTPESQPAVDPGFVLRSGHCQPVFDRTLPLLESPTQSLLLKIDCPLRVIGGKFNRHHASHCNLLVKRKK